MRPINLHEIAPLKRPVQHFSDCYLVSSIGALARSTQGQKILSENIAHCNDGYRVRFQNVDELKLDFFVTQSDIEELIPFRNKYYQKTTVKYQQNPIMQAIEAAMNKLLLENPNKKPFVSRLMHCEKEFEFNKPSNFLKLFTGKKPIILNESGLHMDLTSKKDETIELLEKIDKADDFNFVAGTGLWGKKGFTPLHCFLVEGVNTENQYIQVYEARNRVSKEISFQEVIKIFKFLTGYINA